MPKISVVIPTKNEESVIGETLKHFKKYRKKYDLELIVSDGNSKDSTVKISRKFADKVVLAKGKQNIAIGRNAGARVASSPYILHTDADVRLQDPDRFFQKMLILFGNDDIVAMTTKIRVYPERERFSDRFWHFWINFCVHYLRFFGMFIGKGECQAVRTKTFRKINGYNEKITIGEDTYLFRSLSKHGKIVYLSSPTVFHSPRRFRRFGYVGVLLQYAREGLWLLFTNHNYLREWKPVR